MKITIYNWSTNSRPALQGLPAVVVHHGKVIEEEMRIEAIPLFDLHEAARENGIRNLAEVELAVLEPDGKFSFFTYPRGEGGSSEDDRTGGEQQM